MVYCPMPRHKHQKDRGWVFVAAAGAATIALLVAARLHPTPTRPDSPPEAVSQAEAGPLAGVAVVLDPGHGGEDPGAVCGGASEAALTYRTAAEVAAQLREAGADVTYTVRSRTLTPSVVLIEPPLVRPTDAILISSGLPLRSRNSPAPLWQRAATARRVWVSRNGDPNEARDVFFLSLHYDEFRAPGVSGSVVCVDRRVSGVPEFARVLAQEMAVGHFGRGTDFRGIAGLSGRKLGVLDPDYNPVPEKALLELATLSNTQDALQAGDPAWRGEMARRIVEAVTRVHRGRADGTP